MNLNKYPDTGDLDMKPNVVKLAEAVSSIEEVAYSTARYPGSCTVELFLIAKRLEAIAALIPPSQQYQISSESNFS